MKLLCCGDSNTYGFDSRGMLDDRYPTAIRWTGRLRNLGYQVINDGRNGREIPHHPGEIHAALQVIHAANADMITIMLGSNDLLASPFASAQTASQRMATFLQAIRVARPAQKILLIAPVPMQPGTWVQDDRLLRESAVLAAAYQPLATQFSTAFADTSRWKIALGFDGVHFTEEGHREFALQLQKLL